MFAFVGYIGCSVPRAFPVVAPPVEDAAPLVRMTETGTFRNGPGVYSGLTVVSGSGAISVYDGPDATSLSRLVHSIPAATVGAYPLADETITNGWIVLDPDLTVDIEVD